MNRQSFGELPPPPGVMGALRAGFDAVSSHVWLILLPFLLDVFLWLGPRVSISRFLRPFAEAMFNQARQTLTSSADLQRFTEYQAAISDLIERFNLLSLFGKLQFFPIGISSLLTQTMPSGTPFHSENVVHLTSFPAVVGLAFTLVFLGWIAGAVYYRWVSWTTLGAKQPEARITLSWAVLQSLLLCVLWAIGLLVVTIPTMMVLTLLTFLSPALASGALLLLLIFSFWLIVPLFFTPHGIFVRGQNAFHSIFTSLRMARFTLPTSGLFILAVFLLSTGLNYLWSVPPDDSWMVLVGIAGHAFIRTALLSASFVYYRDMNAWLQTVFEKLKQKQSLPAQGA